MSTPKLLQAFLLFIIGVTLYSCGNEENNIYYKGVIINRAESEYPMGMIRFMDVFEGDDELESPARAIIYHVDDCNNSEMFDLQDTVLFRIGLEGKYQVARNVNSNFSEIDEASSEQLFEVLSNIQLNLHNADVHREGPKHTRRHIIQRIGQASYSDGRGNDVYYLIETEKEFTRQTKNVFIRKSDFDTYPSGIFFFEKAGFNVINANQGVDPSVYNMSLTHDHTH